MKTMAGEEEVVNIEVIGRKHFQYKSIMKRYFNYDAASFYQVIRNKEIYHVILKNGLHVRFDIYKNKPTILMEKVYYHELIDGEKINYPKFIGIQETPKSLFKICEWIEGIRIGECWNMPHMFRKAGEQLAKINLTKDPESDYFLTFEDFNKHNAIWTKNSELYLIGNSIRPKEKLDGGVAKMLLKNICDRERIIWFLKGYRNIRDASMIDEIVKERNYKW